MTKDDIIRMAQECQLIGMRPHLDGIYQETLELFAALVAAAQREDDAKLIEGYPYWIGANAKSDIAAAIRARGTT